MMVNEKAENLVPKYSDGPPWLFTGRAVYQLHLVKTETARPLIPKEFRLVEAFGYTLGGFFLAEYDNSPAGVFDELVVIAGIVWNPPTSCAWASRVLVSSQDACRHGRKVVGLPSHVAAFSKKTVDVTEERHEKHSRSFLKCLGVDSTGQNDQKQTSLEITENIGSFGARFPNINVCIPGHKMNGQWLGPRVRISLPSFSGNTRYVPYLLKYSCQLECRVRAVKHVDVTTDAMEMRNDCNELPVPAYDGSVSPRQKMIPAERSGDMQPNEEDTRKRSLSILLSKPILTLEFSSMEMHVEAPREIEALKDDISSNF